MIIRFNDRGSGGSDGPIRYLMGKFGTVDGRMPTREEQAAGLGLRAVAPEVLRGDIDLVAGLIDASPYAQKYKSGCLSFAESDLTPEKKRELMDSFEAALFPGLEQDQYTALWIEHRDKGRLELNFLIPTVELTTGKRLQPYYHPVDMYRMGAWQTMTNAENGFHDPDDPANQRALSTPRNLPRNKQEAAKAITAGLLQMAEKGLLQSRSDVVKTLTSAGFDVVRETKSSISIADPEGGRNIRLKGALYERHFEFSATLSADISGSSERYRADLARRLQEARREYSDGAEIKREYHRKRYQRPEPPDAKICAQDMGVLRNRRDLAVAARTSSAMVAGHDANRELASDQSAAEAIGRAREERQQDQISGLWGPDLHPRSEKPKSVHKKQRPKTDVHTRGVLNDGARAAASERIRRFRERVAEAAKLVREGFAGFTEFVRGHSRAESSAHRASDELSAAMHQIERASTGLKQASTGLERASERLEVRAEATQEKSRGMRR